MAIINYDGISGINSITSVGSGVQFYNTTGSASFTITPSGTGGATLGDVTVSSINSGPVSGTRNRIINGDMRIDQRNAGATQTALGFSVDRWFTSGAGGTGIYSSVRSTTAPAGFTNSLLLTVTTADTSIAAGDLYYLGHSVEGFNTADLSLGTADAKSFTLSFWVRSSIAGIYAVRFANSAANRSYVAQYTINAANTFEYKTVTVAGDTSGTWLTDNSLGLNILWALGAGSTWETTAGSWTAGNFVSTSAATEWVSTAGATFYITGVQLEPGSVATPFERRSYGAELALCQRYYEKSFNVEVAPANGGTATSFVTEEGFSAAVSTNRLGSGTVVRFAVTKRASPTITKIGNSSGQWRWIAPAGTAHTYSANIEPANVGASGFVMQQQVSDGSLVFLQGHWTASIEL